MTNMRRAVGSALIAGALVSGGPAHATLHDRGNGLIYDDVLKLTWLKDVTHAGMANWTDVISYADRLVYAGYDDWRLPTLTPVNGSTFNSFFSKDGSTDYGYNISYPGRIGPPPDRRAVSAGFTGNELAYMFFVNLGNLAAHKVDGTLRDGTAGVNWGIVNASFVDGATGETVTFENLLETVGVWTNFPGSEVSTFAFLTTLGFNDVAGKDQRFAAWAVRNGDVAPDVAPAVNSVPEPGTLVMLLVGFLSLASRRRI